MGEIWFLSEEHYESDASHQKKIYNSTYCCTVFPAPLMHTRLPPFPAGAESYVSGVTELIFKVCLFWGVALLGLVFLMLLL